jgi:hypothetical protein
VSDIATLLLQINGAGLFVACVGLWALRIYRDSGETVIEGSAYLVPMLAFGSLGFLTNLWVWAPFNVAHEFWPFWVNLVAALVWVGVAFIVCNLLHKSLPDRGLE